MGDSLSLGDRTREQRRSDLRKAARALLREPLLQGHGPTAEDFGRVRQHARELQAWFDRNTGWHLHVDSEAARLRKSPGAPDDATHPARETTGARSPLTRRRYVLLCLGLAVLERSEAQIALGRLAEQVVLEAADDAISGAGVVFTLEERGERADLVAVVRLLVAMGVLAKVAGDEEDYVRSTGDVLYDVRRRVLAGLLVGRVGPSMVTARTFEERLAELAADPLTSGMESEELRNKEIRHRLTRRLLDDPVLYFTSLSEEERNYLSSQRAAITSRISELTGLVAEVRAEGIAMVDPEDDLTDVRMPEKGTHGHVTLLLAQHLSTLSPRPVTVEDLAAQVRSFAREYGSYWAKTAKEPGAEKELVERALTKLRALGLVRVESGPAAGDRRVLPLPALARYAVASPVIGDPSGDHPLDTEPPAERESGA
ncbi:TIGR02678 family protein [Nocardiopsis suaedae]|uniref:TIGR02678 family protein n=1 Tax=Nocardiopsis suaedae TaxID=3018444 RepID=A0ABT4TPR7_9ACTN|nr:TIGR02678 family protein [Nocardiopsis suaedae]MDA2806641.1 TIGR02678 family protein [Nocardiopsis suaedae]